jgi:hypothetical protein
MYSESLKFIGVQGDSKENYYTTYIMSGTKIIKKVQIHNQTTQDPGLSNIIPAPPPVAAQRRRSLVAARVAK